LSDEEMQVRFLGLEHQCFFYTWFALHGLFWQPKAITELRFSAVFERKEISAD
jgi:hypothetical protein